MGNAVTYESVKQAMEALRAEGLYPSLRAVRVKIGKGSLASIQPLHKKIMEELPYLPYNPKDNETWKLIIQAADKTFKDLVKSIIKNSNDIKLDLNQQIKSLNDELTLLNNDKKAYYNKILDLESTIKSLESKVSFYENHIKILQDENIELLLKIKEIENHESKLHAINLELQESREMTAKLKGKLELYEQLENKKK
jgi:predicted RNase H-like nuclease (RuvC/YqgF family)